jgi:hypothetical protein
MGKISDYVTMYCRIGQEWKCCRYLVVGTQGFQCAKLTSLKHTIDAKVITMSAKSDNCDGMSLVTSVEVLNKKPATHEVLDLVYTPEEGQECFSGTLEECNDFVESQRGATSTYEIVPIVFKSE